MIAFQGELRPTREQLSAALTALRAFWRSKADSLERAAPNPHEWWLQNQTQGAVSSLKGLARMYLSIPASSADVERTWSSAAFLATVRPRLLARNLERQVVIRDWILSVKRKHSDANGKVQKPAYLAALQHFLAVTIPAARGANITTVIDTEEEEGELSGDDLV